MKLRTILIPLVILLVSCGKEKISTNGQTIEVHFYASDLQEPDVVDVETVVEFNNGEESIKNLELQNPNQSLQGSVLQLNEVKQMDVTYTPVEGQINVWHEIKEPGGQIYETSPVTTIDTDIKHFNYIFN
jgi:hypothetical protein